MRGYPFPLAAVLIPALSATAGDLFRRPPTVERAGQGAIISFELREPADVEVAVLDRAGAVVRHLACGVPGGGKPPPDPLRPGPAQAIVWDGRDDTGAIARGGPFRARIRAGMQVKLGRIIGDPATLRGKVYGLATDADGNLYVASGAVYDATPVFSIKVFDARGRYLRTILPMPADLPVGRAGEFGAGRSEDGYLQPKNHHALVPYLQDGGIVAFIGHRVRKGRLWLLDTHGRICRIDARDGSPIAWNAAPRTIRPSGGPMCWAVAPDGRTLYMAGWWDARKKSGTRGDGVVWRVDPESGDAAELFAIEVPEESPWLTEPNGWYHFKNWGRKNGQAALHGLAVDERGRIHVCDRVNQRLAVYGGDGEPIGFTAIPWPDHVALGRGGEPVYVVTRQVIDGYKAINRLKIVKLTRAIDGRPVAELELPGRNAPQMALSAGASPPVIWLSHAGRDGERLVRIEDRGEELAVAGEIPVETGSGIVKLWVDPLSDAVYVNNGWNRLTRFDGVTGTARVLPLRAIDLAIGPDRCLYVMGRKGWKEPIYRCTRQLEPVPFSGTGRPTAGKEIYGRYGCGWSNKGLAVAPDGRIFVRHMYEWTKYHVIVFKPDGTPEPHDRVAGGIVGPVDAQAGGVRVDRKGRIYIGMAGHPEGIAKARPYEGCVLKIAPEGGGLVARKGAIEGIAFRGGFFEGALAAYPHLAPRQARGCVCKEARFDIDAFGRVYVPNVLDFCVRVYDNAGNRILRFGHYGNADSTGPAGRIPVPAIPLGWPMSCGVNRTGRIYIADVLNHRIVRVDVGFRSVAIIPLP